ncbi:MAG: hypothetical protein ABIE22_03770 [archaeon]
MDKRKRGQVSIFVIIAILIVAVIVGYFVLKSRLSTSEIPAAFQPAEQYFLSCIEDYGTIGKDTLGDQGGYIYLPEFEPGSDYRPFSSQLNFYGTPVPYWYYVSGNNIISEQKPSKAFMEQELVQYIEENLADCGFGEFIMQGYEIDVGENPQVDVSIEDSSIFVSVRQPVSMSYGGESVAINQHDVEIDSSLGKFYDLATEIYNEEKQNMFLENYAVDVLRLYAPVDGVELSCSPKVWIQNEIEQELKAALEGNMGAIKLRGDYYSLSKDENKYFVQDIPTDESVNFLYSSEWPTRLEVWDSSNGVLLAEPVGLQEGLGMLGFCYVPYHFVYDLDYPVLIQIYNELEIFQFPIGIIIDKNKPREALPVDTTLGDAEAEICSKKIREVMVYTYNMDLEPVEADVSFSCLGDSCDIGSTKRYGDEALLTADFPACVNGLITARADGYAQKRLTYSTNQGGSATIFLDKLYDVEVDFQINGEESLDYAVIIFDSEDNSQVAAWPDQKTVRLSEGMYNISVYSYRNSSITVPGIDEQICNDVPKSGLLGIVGITEEKCFDIKTEDQKIDNSISGGGKGEEYFIESQLQLGKVMINVNSIPVPDSIEEMQDAYSLIEVKPVYVDFV